MDGYKRFVILFRMVGHYSIKESFDSLPEAVDYCKRFVDFKEIYYENYFYKTPYFWLEVYDTLGKNISEIGDLFDYDYCFETENYVYNNE